MAAVNCCNACSACVWSSGLSPLVLLARVGKLLNAFAVLAGCLFGGLRKRGSCSLEHRMGARQ